MMADPSELARGYAGVDQEAFFVECRSLSGFSGSPVFASTTRHYNAENAPKVMRRTQSDQPADGERRGLKIDFVGAEGTWGPWLLGIDWGHLPLWKPVFERHDFDIRLDNHWVEQNTGIACVLPAWHILDTLNDEELAKERQKDKELLDNQPDPLIG
jgi:hypothetical protein